MAFRSIRAIPCLPLAAVLGLAGRPEPGAGLRGECYNRSGSGWRLTLVEGVRPTTGSLTFLDKFTGKQVATLGRAGLGLLLPAGARYLIEFNYDQENLYLDFILQDGRGSYVEYVATSPSLDHPLPMLMVKDKHMAPPLDEATDEAVLQAIDDAVSTADGNLVILQGQLGPR